LSLKKGSSEVATNQKSRALASAGACVVCVRLSSTPSSTSSHSECVCVLVSKLLTCAGRRGTNRSGVGGIIVRDSFFSLNTMIRNSPAYSRKKRLLLHFGIYGMKETTSGKRDDDAVLN